MLSNKISIFTASLIFGILIAFVALAHAKSVSVNIGEAFKEIRLAYENYLKRADEADKKKADDAIAAIAGEMIELAQHKRALAQQMKELLIIRINVKHYIPEAGVIGKDIVRINKQIDKSVRVIQDYAELIKPNWKVTNLHQFKNMVKVVSNKMSYLSQGENQRLRALRYIVNQVRVEKFKRFIESSERHAKQLENTALTLSKTLKE